LEFCKNSEIQVCEYPTNGVVRRLKNRNSWDKIWSERMSEEIFQPTEIENVLKIPRELADISKSTKQKYKKYLESVGNEYFHSENERNDNNRSLRVGNPFLQKGGEIMGQKILKNFLEMRSSKYMYNISKPLESESWCSRLSPYIAYGCLSLKAVVQATQIRREELKNLGSDAAKNHRKSLQYFISRLHWQSHFIQKLEDEPKMQFFNLNRDFDAIRKTADKKLLETVFKAKSGIPYIDAVVRQLQQTGWTNFRSRAVLVSFLCNTLMQPWQAVAANVARLFTDYEPGIHYPQFQMQSGTTGINTIRIYNPIYNGEQKDPDGKFIYKYLPELARVPKDFIHEPIYWEGFESLDYPEPIVNVKEANKKARDILWKIKGNTPKAEKDRIIKKHASRSFHGDRKKSLSKNKKEPQKNENQTVLF
ncbi:FAD-binding domain-containing protein, partial [Candidatus Gracilibacteria bacterium]|nr:FAD-binding domain-containing protein [Candidatus Gracilibacteria bacterium]